MTFFQPRILQNVGGPVRTYEAWHPVFGNRFSGPPFRFLAKDNIFFKSSWACASLHGSAARVAGIVGSKDVFIPIHL